MLHEASSVFSGLKQRCGEVWGMMTWNDKTFDSPSSLL